MTENSLNNCIFPPLKDVTDTVQLSVHFLFVALRPNAGHGLLILEVSRSHTTTQHSW